MHVVSVPTVNDHPWDFVQLFRLWSELPRTPEQVVFDFTYCNFLRQNAVAFLGGLVRMLQRHDYLVSFRLGTIRQDIRANLEQNGFLATLGFEGRPWTGNSIPFRQHASQDQSDIVTYLKQHWLGRGWVNVSHTLADAIVGNVWEIYTNAFEHATSPVGVFSCGQHYPRLNELALTVIDFGVSIPQNVRTFLSAPNMRACDALAWAMRRGTTTKPSTGRGMGLNLLSEFVRVNGGKFDVYSDVGVFRLGPQESTASDATLGFRGTAINLTFKCDARRYSLASEASTAPLF